MIDGKPRIGDEVYIHGYIDEIRNDVVIIRNEGGYFGTSDREMFYYEEDERGYGTMNEADRKTEPTCDTCRHKGVEGCEQPCLGCGCCGLYEAMTGNDKLKEKVVEFIKSCARCKHRPIGAMMCEESCHYEPKTETQTETQNSNLTFEKRTMRDCYNCKKFETEDECIECHYEPKDEPKLEGIWNAGYKTGYDKGYKDAQKVKDSQGLVNDLVKAFCEDGTWLERQGVYTLTLAEAKQRAVDIIESIIERKEGE